MAGLESARARGKLGGRPRVMDDKKAAMARSMHRDKDLSVKEICSTLGISKTTFYRYLQTEDAA
ncbi:MAG: helix-turn-helix domain-containing protein [Planctomycetota bacterium]